MNIELSEALFLCVVGVAAVGLGCRWWYSRQLRALALKLGRITDAHENTQRMMSQARRQIEDLQRVAEEYRRRHVAAQAARRTRNEALAAIEAAAPPPLPVLPTGGWADTQPM